MKIANFRFRIQTASTTRIRIFLKTELFFHPVLVENGHRKSVLSKTLSRMEIFKNTGFSFTRRLLAKTEVLEYIVVIHRILLESRMLCERCYMWTRICSKTEEKYRYAQTVPYLHTKYSSRLAFVILDTFVMFSFRVLTSLANL